MAKLSESRMELAEKETTEATRAEETGEEAFATVNHQHSCNVVGMGLGVQWIIGQPTRAPATVVLVTGTLPENQVSKNGELYLKLKLDVLRRYHCY